MDGGHEGRVLAVDEVSPSPDSLNEKQTKANNFFNGVWRSAMKITGAAVAGALVLGVATNDPVYMGLGAGVGAIAGAKVAMSKHQSWTLSEEKISLF